MTTIGIFNDIGISVSISQMRFNYNFGLLVQSKTMYQIFGIFIGKMDNDSINDVETFFSESNDQTLLELYLIIM